MGNHSGSATGENNIKLFDLMRNSYVNLTSNPSSSLSSGKGPIRLNHDAASAAAADDDDVERQAYDLHAAAAAADDHGSNRPGGPANRSTLTRPTAFLEGLRGLAAFLVYTSHHVSWFYGADDDIQHGFGYHGAKSFTTLPFIRIFFTGGSAAVAIFFVLSGYVLSKSPLQTLLLLQEQGESSLTPLYKRLLDAAARRPFRLYLPPAGVSLAFAFIMHLPFGLAPRLTWPEPKSSIVAEVGNWFVEICEALNPFIPHGIAQKWFPYDPPIWTMAVEFKGSMLVFALVAASGLVRPARHRLSALVVLGLVLLVMYDWPMACFVAGMALALNDVQDGGGEMIPSIVHRLAVSANISLSPVVYHHVMFLIGWWLLCQTAGPRDVEYSYNTYGWYWLTMLMPTSYYNDEYWRWWNTIGAVLLVYAVLRLRWLQHLLTTRALRYLGRVSFSLYLTHIPFLWTIGDRIYRLAGAVKPDSNMQTWFDYKLQVPDRGPHGLSTRFLVAQLFILPLNLGLAQVCTTVLDEPSVRFSRWIVSRGGDRRR